MFKSAEDRSLSFVPLNERYGNPRDQFTLWFAANMLILTTVTGGLGIALGLSLSWTLLAIVLGNVFGAFFVAGHAVQGPHLGIPQMIQSRAQFGYLGAVVPLVAVVIMYIGYFAGNQLIAAEALHIVAGVDVKLSIVFLGLITFVITFYGYGLILRVEKFFAYVSGLVFLGISVLVVMRGVPGSAWDFNQFSWPAFLSVLGAVVAWQLTYAPYIADYTRYLPEDTPSQRLIWYTYFGLVASCIWVMGLGAFLTVSFSGYLNNPSETLAQLLPGSIAPTLFVFIVLGCVCVNVLNLYGSFMAVRTIFDFFVKVRDSLVTRFIFMGVVFVISIFIAIVISETFAAFFEGLLEILGYILFPWTSVNLVDYFFLRKGNYSVADIFDRRGKYGLFNWQGIVSYTAAILLQIPMMGTAFFTGPIYNLLGGVDYAWLVALLVPGGLYLVLMTLFPDRAQRELQALE